MAPLTRYRAPNNIPGEMMLKHYQQRASDGGLLIAEATAISINGGISKNVPRIDTKEGMQGYKKVVEAVHEKGGLIYCQLIHYGRTIIPATFAEYAEVLGPSSIKLEGDGYVVPREMTVEDMDQAVADFAQAAANAMECGFDGVEIHGANGYLLDQFVEDNINVRTDEFGGLIENRCKFPLRVLDAVVAKVGRGKVGYRISPWDSFQEADDSLPVEHFMYFCEQLEKRKIAYVHCIEARSDANGGKENDDAHAQALGVNVTESSCAQFKKVLVDTVLLSAGGWNDKNFKIEGYEGVDGYVYGRLFTSNPDLPERLKNGWKLTPYNRDYFYQALEPVGYVDYDEYKEE